jgi:catechol 2,3-dioxygenase-like lactoylglutathione lyase family enzyme
LKNHVRHSLPQKTTTAMEIIDANVTVMVSDMDQSVKFYESLGLKIKSRWGNHYAMLTGGGMTLGLHPGTPRSGDRAGFSLGFIVSNLNDAKTLLARANATFQESNDKSGIFAHTKDPDGTVVYFMQPLYGEPDKI